MIRSPNNIQVRKRKWKTVLFLLRKRKRNIIDHVRRPADAYYCSSGVEERDLNHRNDVDWEFEASGKVNPRLGLDNHNNNNHNDDDDYCCSGVDERDGNPRNDVDWEFEGSETVNPRLGLDDHNDDDYYCSGGDERDENPRNDADVNIEGLGKENTRLGLDNSDDDHDVDYERDENTRNDDDWQIEGFGKENTRLGLDHGEEVKDEEEEVEESLKSAVMVVSERKKDGGDAPPEDDCCPICFDNFSIACKTNCGHWFCANCILQFWTYRTVLQKCNCPICARPISKLTPEASLLMMHEVEVVEVLKSVQRYNRLFQGGINGVIRKVFEVPNVFKRMLYGLMDPDRFRGNYYAMRSFALLMSCLYNIGSFEFIPTGALGVRRLFDLCAIALVVILCLVGICHRLLLRQRVRRLAANQL
ncbi:hypothetical protein M8C21_006306 [Ambrosia artemisiifolia]|uniref:RING-type domain-containing protein n=1 Tax=Ambrosia artemisiifolia TaxID=4212 RepID=A0AAD5G7X6_AMBAR|nr:hypothetical protein M8C21_006306 [Ambrosia artemisiifolia]